MGTRQTARDRRNQASAASDARNNANTPATMSALSKAQMDLATYGTQSANLTTDWNAVRMFLAKDYGIKTDLLV